MTAEPTDGGLITSEDAAAAYIELAEADRRIQNLMHVLTSYQGRHPVPFTADQLADAVHWATSVSCIPRAPGWRGDWHGGSCSQ